MIKNQLIAMTAWGYDSGAPHKTGAGIGVLEITRAHNTRLACFFVPHSHTLSMVGCTGAEKSAPGSLVSGYANPVQSTTSEIGVSCGGYYQSTREAAIMATIPTPKPQFIRRIAAVRCKCATIPARLHHIAASSERDARHNIRQEVCYA